MSRCCVWLVLLAGCLMAGVLGASPCGEGEGQIFPTDEGLLTVTAPCSGSVRVQGSVEVKGQLQASSVVVDGVDLTTVLAEAKTLRSTLHTFAPCLSQPCRHGGTCTPLEEGAFNCTCPPDVLGLRCEVAVQWSSTFAIEGAETPLSLAVPATTPSSLPVPSVYSIAQTLGGVCCGGLMATGLQDLYLVRANATTGSVAFETILVAPFENVLASTIDGDVLYLGGSTDTAWPGFYPQGGTDAYVAALATNTHSSASEGTLLWYQSFGTPTEDTVRGIAVHNGRVYVMGSTQGDLGNPTQDYGRLGLYLAVLDQASGARIFNTTIENGAADGLLGNDMSVDGATGAVYIAGMRVMSASDRRGMVMRVNGATGAVEWTRLLNGTEGHCSLTGVGVGDDGEVYVTGFVLGGLLGGTTVLEYSGTVDTVELIVSRDTDAIVGRVDGATGDEVWMRQVSGKDGDNGDRLVVGSGADRGVFVVGSTRSRLGSPTDEVLSARDLFAMHLSRDDGTLRWLVQRDMDETQFGKAVALVDDETALIVTGSTRQVTTDDDVFMERWSL